MREFYHRVPGDRRGYSDDQIDFVAVSYQNHRAHLDRRRPKLVTTKYSFSPLG